MQLFVNFKKKSYITGRKIHLKKHHYKQGNWHHHHHYLYTLSWTKTCHIWLIIWPLDATHRYVSANRTYGCTTEHYVPLSYDGANTATNIKRGLNLAWFHFKNRVRVYIKFISPINTYNTVSGLFRRTLIQPNTSSSCSKEHSLLVLPPCPFISGLLW